MEEEERESRSTLRARTNLSGFALVSAALALSALALRAKFPLDRRGWQEGGHDSALTLPKPSETIAGVLTRPISTLPCPILQRSVT